MFSIHTLWFSGFPPGGDRGILWNRALNSAGHMQDKYSHSCAVSQAQDQCFLLRDFMGEPKSSTLSLGHSITARKLRNFGDEGQPGCRKGLFCTMGRRLEVWGNLGKQETARRARVQGPSGTTRRDPYIPTLSSHLGAQPNLWGHCPMPLWRGKDADLTHG